MNWGFARSKLYFAQMSNICQCYANFWKQKIYLRLTFQCNWKEYETDTFWENSKNASRRGSNNDAVSEWFILFQVLNGLFERSDWREAMDSLPLGIVPAGSGNALARSLVHQQQELFNPSSQVRQCLFNNVGEMKTVLTGNTTSVYFGTVFLLQ